ncbi:uncharacterized protein METZ01_LOCUS42700 [marine metagenome]|uniref:Uncharacterized protein n=1 Tax=marine metagenome TaxID=408172 RepID=A0A381RDI4_9ZZZZ
MISNKGTVAFVSKRVNHSSFVADSIGVGKKPEALLISTSNLSVLSRISFNADLMELSSEKLACIVLQEFFLTDNRSDFS